MTSLMFALISYIIDVLFAIDVNWTCLAQKVRKLLCATSSFDIPLHDSEDVGKCTLAFKQTAMVLELQSLYVKLGTESPLFSKASNGNVRTWKPRPKRR